MHEDIAAEYTPLNLQEGRRFMESGFGGNPGSRFTTSPNVGLSTASQITRSAPQRSHPPAGIATLRTCDLFVTSGRH
jgi:hypothetical protein